LRVIRASGLSSCDFFGGIVALASSERATYGRGLKANEAPTSQTRSQQSSDAPLANSRAFRPSASRKRTPQSDDDSSDYANTESHEGREEDKQDMEEQELEEASLEEDNSIPADNENDDNHET